MAELVIKEKYPNSWRIDHPDFGDVCRTTFAKGVIKDFKKVSEDPLEVTSLVKVEVDGEEFEDYIPIFYHPRAHYWDHWDPDAEEGEETQLATEFNEDEDKQYFEKAWMSFRGGDEVVVMLKATIEEPELKPVAVMGFADGVPRLGESLFLLRGIYNNYLNYFNDDYTEALIPPEEVDMGGAVEAYFYAFKSLQDFYTSYGTPYETFAAMAQQSEAPPGACPADGPLPEGFDREKVCVTPKYKVETSLVGEEEVAPDEWYFCGEFDEDFCCKVDELQENPECVCAGEATHFNYWEMAGIFRKGRTIDRTYKYEHYWVVGPIMFCWVHTKTYTIFEGTVYLAKYYGYNESDICYYNTYWYDAGGNLIPNWGDPPRMGVGIDGAIDPLDQGWLTREEVLHYGVYNLQCTPAPAVSHYHIVDYPTLHDHYTLAWWEFPPEETIEFSQILQDMRLYAAVYTPELWDNPNPSQMIEQADMYFLSKKPKFLEFNWNPDFYEFLVPAHTKEEMQAAGFWPKEEAA